MQPDNACHSPCLSKMESPIILKDVKRGPLQYLIRQPHLYTHPITHKAKPVQKTFQRALRLLLFFFILSSAFFRLTIISADPFLVERREGAVRGLYFAESSLRATTCPLQKWEGNPGFLSPPRPFSSVLKYRIVCRSDDQSRIVHFGSLDGSDLVVLHGIVCLIIVCSVIWDEG
ncbi:hypothetical protein CEXT_660991 [Caerostris extrusa]|uniref:Uncharacterized protein n=1 Tax=Caerostris extrusa TaxID=172846 RepID=A0AAV4Y403_CAEEX|nr:hypothetical protein CEXT_660991 [Caerostris extrusa]